MRISSRTINSLRKKLDIQVWKYIVSLFNVYVKEICLILDEEKSSYFKNKC